LNPPGTAWHYSVSTDVLGAVIERVGHKPLTQVVNDLVTGPLGMRDTAFVVIDRKRLAAAYTNGTPSPHLMSDPQIVPFGPGAGIRYSPTRVFDPKSFPSGGAGMVGSAPDLLRFLEAIRQGGDKILPSRSAAAMMSNQIGDLPVDAKGPGWGFGFGGAVLIDPALAHSLQSSGTWQWGHLPVS
jgi:CubicO group peptidase (beta-lactamase class C family)